MLFYSLGMKLFIFLLLSSTLFCSGAEIDDLRKTAEQGLAVSQFNLGVMYHLGQGVPPNAALAIKWYRKAAKQGYASAQCNLGNMYYNGEGVAKDHAEAVKWYRKAAE